jgi:Cu/Ag efflux protein CusF
MAKVKRSVLKEIVKECLLEILFEGIDSESGFEEEPIRESRQPTRRAFPPSPQRNLAAAVQESQQRRSVFKKPDLKTRRPDVTNEAVAELTNDPMMASIFADTAQTTLQEQVEGRRPPIDTAAAVVEGANDVSDIFEGAGNWAAIAFGETD